MGIRQTLNENPAISAGVTGGLILIAIIVIIFELRGGSHGRRGPGKQFYSDDDGQTYFADDSNKITPFVDSNNKQAVQAVVYKCADGKPFVAYLMRLTEEGRKLAEQAQQDPKAPRPRMAPMMDSEIKKPGAATWLRFDQTNPKPFTDIMVPVCPDGSTTGLQMVQPGS